MPKQAAPAEKNDIKRGSYLDNSEREYTWYAIAASSASGEKTTSEEVVKRKAQKEHISYSGFPKISLPPWPHGQMEVANVDHLPGAAASSATLQR